MGEKPAAFFVSKEARMVIDNKEEARDEERGNAEVEQTEEMLGLVVNG